MRGEESGVSYEKRGRACSLKQVRLSMWFETRRVEILL